MSNTYHTKSYAKVNLFLHITGNTNNIYYTLDSLIMFTKDLYDELSIKESNINDIIVSGPWAKHLSKENILEKVLEVFSEFIKQKKFQITLKKNIPIGAGLGGGSSNAAALLQFLITKYKIEIAQSEILDYAKEIGADISMFLYKKALYINGIGERISPIEIIPEIWAILIYPNISLSTQNVFFKKKVPYKKEIHHIYNFKNSKELLQYLKYTTNDLYQNSISIEPSIKSIIDGFNNIKSCDLVRMTGSGSSCFGLFTTNSEALNALSSLQKKFPLYSIYFTKLI